MSLHLWITFCFWLQRPTTALPLSVSLSISLIDLVSSIYQHFYKKTRRACMSSSYRCMLTISLKHWTFTLVYTARVSVASYVTIVMDISTILSLFEIRCIFSGWFISTLISAQYFKNAGSGSREYMSICTNWCHVIYLLEMGPCYLPAAVSTPLCYQHNVHCSKSQYS